MKKQILIRFLMIGMLHTFLYLWLVPFVIYPKFGHDGFVFTVIVAVLISVSILGTLFLRKKKEHNPNSDVVANK